MNFAGLLILGAIWGASFLFMRIAAPELGAVPLMALRVAIATVVLLPVMLSPVSRTGFKARLWPLFIVGLTNSAIPFCLLAYAAISISAGLDSILNATTPVWAAIISALLFGGRMRAPQWLGLAVALLGVFWVSWPSLGSGAPGTSVAVLAGLLAGVFYGFAANYSKRHLVGTPSSVVAFGSQLFATLILVIPAAALWPKGPVRLDIWLDVAALGVFCTGLAYLLYFRLIERAGATFATSVTFLVPLFSVAWGALFLGESVSVYVLTGGALVLRGTAMSIGRISWKKSALQ